MGFNLLYFSNVKFEFYHGVKNKIFSQIDGFVYNGVNVDLLYYENFKIFFKNKFLTYVNLPLLRNFYLLYYLIKFNLKSYSYLYVRFIFPSFFIFCIVLISKIRNNNIKILVEIPTYPYYREYPKNFVFFILNLIDKVFWRILKYFVYKIITFSEDKFIYDIPTINLFNCISSFNFPVVNKKWAEYKNLNFISVANFNFWHGTDRFINSLSKYKPNNFYLHLVGEGEFLENLKNSIISDSYLNDHVVFHGFKIGEDLENVYKMCNISLGCLGNHRKGIHTIQALKNREYCSYGLPIVFSEDDPGFRNSNFVYRVSEDENLIDLNHLYNWFINISVSSLQIHNYSKQFSWNLEIKKLLNNIS
ncbi:glycosyltransferase [Algoriphagus sp. CAU 1675]|uniref:glycosyltransferase n=1 Tax=Algoriphagus sp. CAU 1675 TaxID=3032597 RepID=UPI0023DA64F7|nr:glycosyltransferase [Algoriphagus sp. CAU 1675]MDF2158190.1 glycosyltransferase [Algoriphagus sp. CAU 1675]